MKIKTNAIKYQKCDSDQPEKYSAPHWKNQVVKWQKRHSPFDFSQDNASQVRRHQHWLGHLQHLF